MVVVVIAVVLLRVRVRVSTTVSRIVVGENVLILDVVICLLWEVGVAEKSANRHAFASHTYSPVLLAHIWTGLEPPHLPCHILTHFQPNQHADSPQTSTQPHDTHTSTNTHVRADRTCRVVIEEKTAATLISAASTLSESHVQPALKSTESVDELTVGW